MIKRLSTAVIGLILVASLAACTPVAPPSDNSGNGGNGNDVPDNDNASPDNDNDNTMPDDGDNPFPEPPFDGGIVFTEWQAHGENVNLDIAWFTPPLNVAVADVNRTSWAQIGAESAELPTALVADGLHTFELFFDGPGSSADVAFFVGLFNVAIGIAQDMSGPDFRKIVFDVLDGEARVAFNGFAPAGDETAGGPTLFAALEGQTGWRVTSDAMNINLNLIDPDGVSLNQYDDSWGFQGLARVSISDAALLKEGTYEFQTFVDGPGLSAEVSAAFLAPGVDRRHERFLSGPAWRTILIDMLNGEGRVVFDGWLEFGEDGAAQLSGGHSIEVLGAWRVATENMHVNLFVQAPDGSELDVWRTSWEPQGAERVMWPLDAPIENGTWRIGFVLDGSGLQADVDFLVDFLGWTFEFRGPLMGYMEREILITVVDGEVTTVINGWE